MAIELRSVGVSPGAASTLCVIVNPAGLTIGDLMIAQEVITFRLADDTDVYSPANWTEIRQDKWISGDYAFTSALFWKIADATDVAAADFTFTIVESLSNYNRGAITAWKTGTFNTVAPINAHNGQDNGSSTTVTAPTITPSVENCMILMVCGIYDNNTQSNYAIVTDNPASWDEAYDISLDSGADVALSMGYALRPETSATGNGTATTSGSDINIGQLLAIAPAGAVPIKHYIPHCGPRKKRTQFFPTLKLGG